MNYFGKKTLLKHSIIVFISSILLSCAATEESAERDAYVAESSGTDCISQMSVRDYRVLDEANLIVSESVRRKYHVVLSRRAYGLRSTWQIGFRSPTGRICAGFSDLIVDDGFGPGRIRIASIRQLTPEDEEDLLIRFGKIEPETEQTPATQEVEGAEVEELD
ncbi:MAG: DUF6491 family protein [Gammaproteobacteria bacterium]|nr:DUF6491 family protein [Gammaproteobacteria bacterium]